jgi:hypothetical protein
MKLPNGEKQCQIYGSYFVHSNDPYSCTVTVDPIINSGVARLEVIFKDQNEKYREFSLI